MNHLFSGPSFVFWGLFQGVLASVILDFFVVLLRPTSPSHHEKACNGPGK